MQSVKIRHKDYPNTPLDQLPTKQLLEVESNLQEIVADRSIVPYWAPKAATDLGILYYVLSGITEELERRIKCQSESSPLPS